MGPDLSLVLEELRYQREKLDAACSDIGKIKGDVAILSERIRPLRGAYNNIAKTILTHALAPLLAAGVTAGAMRAIPPALTHTPTHPTIAAPK